MVVVLLEQTVQQHTSEVMIQLVWGSTVKLVFCNVLIFQYIDGVHLKVGEKLV